MNTIMATFINSRHPVYEGINNSDGNQVKVILTSWKADIHLGHGEIYPYRVPSIFNDGPPHHVCFDFKDGMIKFTQDDFCHSTFMAFKMSENFKSLAIVDKISEKVLGILNLVEQHKVTS